MADGNSSATLRSSVPADIRVLFQLIQAQAEFNQQLPAVTGNTDTLSEHLFGLRPYAEAIVAEHADNVVGFALFFYNYSTFLTKPGIYIEDLFIFPEYRQQGIGKAILTYLAQQAVTRNCGRLEWTVAIWNEPAINFYQHLGASVLPDWRICRVAGDFLLNLASQT
ncbi:MAG: GNAT family N-acetyltransferase [Microcoleus vaginatus WJT46-NPBG5]|nr:GNAT family N-acetyltransferase [Microcoleus vaginatus WJT46-NPBG5]